jgi:hypothetical protein
MGRPTKLGIQRALLNAEPITWVEATGKTATLRLAKPEERRLFAFLLNSTVREPKGLSAEFISGLSTAFHGSDDPAEQVAYGADRTDSFGPWKLYKIETEGFGGLNVWGGSPFVLVLEGESLLLQGPNGSGKSS